MKPLLSVAPSPINPGGWRISFASGSRVWFTKTLWSRSRDGTLLLLPGQESAALGRAYGEVKYAKYTATLYRQYIDTPYVNQQDNRMTPNTFEAYTVMLEV